MKLKRSYFKEITEEHFNFCEYIILNKGRCSELCKRIKFENIDCPFRFINSTVAGPSCHYYSTNISGYKDNPKLAEYCEMFLKFKDPNIKEVERKNVPDEKVVDVNTSNFAEIMKAYLDGKQIQSREKGTFEWKDHKHEPMWDFSHFEYRIKPDLRPFTLKELLMRLNYSFRYIGSPETELKIKSIDFNENDIESSVINLVNNDETVNNQFTLKQMFNKFEIKILYKWEPCGVTEDE